MIPVFSLFTYTTYTPEMPYFRTRQRPKYWTEEAGFSQDRSLYGQKNRVSIPAYFSVIFAQKTQNIDMVLWDLAFSLVGVGTIIQFGPCGLLVPCFSLIGVFDQHCARVWPLRSSVQYFGRWRVLKYGISGVYVVYSGETQASGSLSRSLAPSI